MINNIKLLPLYIHECWCTGMVNGRVLYSVSQARLKITRVFPSTGIPIIKAKTVMRSTYIYNGNSSTCRTASLYRDGHWKQNKSAMISIFSRPENIFDMCPDQGVTAAWNKISMKAACHLLVKTRQSINKIYRGLYFAYMLLLQIGNCCCPWFTVYSRAIDAVTWQILQT